MQTKQKQSNSKQNNIKLTCSVIVATRNRLADLLMCLDSLQKQTFVPTELIIVDSSDNKLSEEQKFTKKYSAQLFPKTKLIYKHTGPGLTYQRNIGIKLASGEILYFFDDDTVLNNDYIEQMQSAFFANKKYVGGMGSINGVSQKKITFRRMLRTLFLLQRDQSSGMFTWSGMPTHTYGTKKFKNVEVLGGCCMAYRKSVVKKELFDENLSRYSYMEDCDFSCRASRQGELFFNPQACLDHNHSPLARDNIENNRAMYIKNYSYLFFKNFYPKNYFKIIAYYWSVIGLFLEAILDRNGPYIKGYCKGLKQFYSNSDN